MSVQVLIPYWPTPSRVLPASYVLDLYRTELPGWPVSLCVGDRYPFSLGRALNPVVADLPPKVDVLVFNDADSLVQPHAIYEAAALALIEGRPVCAWTEYHRLSRADSAAIPRGGYLDAFNLLSEWSMPTSESTGCFAIRRADYEKVGGFDPAFVGPGRADNAFWVACEANGLPVRRLPGKLVHLWHERDDNQEQAEANEQRYLRYLDARGNADAIRALREDL